MRLVLLLLTAVFFSSVASAQQVPVCQQLLNEANSRMIAVSDDATKQITDLKKQIDDLKAKYEPKSTDKKKE